MAGFKAGDEVLVQKLKREGVVLEILKDGSYKVAVGPLSMNCKEKELKPLPPDRYKQFSAKKKASYGAPSVKLPEGRDHLTVDLHGLRLADAMPLVEKKLNEALLADCSKLEIIHGVGMGILLTNVHKYLKGMSVVKRFQLDPHNPGTTWVYF
jgi:DNA mismatch repair protein MutS2